MPSKNKKKWKRNPCVVARQIGKETILIPTGKSIVSSKCLFTLNDTGSFIWEKLASPCNFKEISSAITKEFNVTKEQAEKDLTRFLKEMAEEGCILEESNDI
jgi:hypothetical protein